MESQDQHWPQDNSPRTVLTTWKISYEQIQRQSQDAANLLKLWAFLDCRDLWFELVACFRGSVEIPAWLLNITESKLQFRATLGLLLRYSLADARTETESYAMHPVLHTWCYSLSSMTGEDRSLRQLAICIIGQDVPLTDEKNDWKILRRLLPHARQVFPEVSKTRDRGETVPKYVLDGMHKLGLLLQYYDAFAESETIFRLILEWKIQATEFGHEHVSTLQTVGRLGDLYWQQGKLIEGEKMYQRMLRSEMTLGSDHELILDAIHGLGVIYTGREKFAEAEDLLQRALKGKEKLHGAKAMSTLTTVDYLGRLYADQGKFVVAEKMYLQAIQGYEEAYGPQHLAVLVSVHNLGMLYQNQGKFLEAEPMYRRALEWFEKTLGPEHTSTLATVNHMGYLYRDQRKYKEEETMFQRLFEGYKKLLGPNHEETLSATHNLGDAYNEQAKFPQAERMLQRALEGYEMVLGLDHEKTLDTGYRLGHAYAEQAKFVEAETILQRTLEGHEKVYGSDHEYTRDTAHVLKRSRLRAKEAREAESSATGSQVAFRVNPPRPKKSAHFSWFRSAKE